VLDDNESGVNATSKVEARLNKKNNAICFHAVSEACAAGWIRVGWEPTDSNISDLFTKMLPLETRGRLLSSTFIRTQAVDQGGCFGADSTSAWRIPPGRPVLLDRRVTNPGRA
jgi:hypothetical protein